MSDESDVVEFNGDASSVTHYRQPITVGALGRYEVIELFGVCWAEVKVEMTL